MTEDGANVENAIETVVIEGTPRDERKDECAKSERYRILFDYYHGIVGLSPEDADHLVRHILAIVERGRRQRERENVNHG